MGQATTIEERIRIVELSEQGLTDGAIAAQTGWSVQAVRKWRRRGRRLGRAGLSLRQGRPPRGACSSFGAPVVETLRAARVNHPGWGPATLQVELARQDIAPPSRATLARWLKASGCTRRYVRRVRLAGNAARQARMPHERWQMDAQGHAYVHAVGMIAPINLNDCYSHARLLCYPCQVGDKRWQRHPNSEDYQLALRLAFVEWGLPRQLQVDHASVFYDSHTASPFPTRLHLWLVALGIEVHFSQGATDQALTERSHQLWQQQVWQGAPPFGSWQDLYLALRQRRADLNWRLPCRGTDNLPPLVAHPQARHSGRPYHPHSEADLLDLARLYAYLAEHRWFRLVSKDGTFSLGAQTYFLSQRCARQQVEITFDPADARLVCHDAAGQALKRLPIRHLTRPDLIGQFATSVNLPLFQLELPLDWHAIHAVRLSETLAV